MLPSTIANPAQASLMSRRFPSRNADASPTGNRLTMNGIRIGSTNDSAAARTQYAAGPANGKRRRRKSGSTRHATAGTENHSVVSGAPG